MRRRSIFRRELGELSSRVWSGLSERPRREETLSRAWLTTEAKKGIIASQEYTLSCIKSAFRANYVRISTALIYFSYRYIV